MTLKTNKYLFKDKIKDIYIGELFENSEAEAFPFTFLSSESIHKKCQQTQLVKNIHLYSVFFSFPLFLNTQAFTSSSFWNYRDVGCAVVLGQHKLKIAKIVYMYCIRYNTCKYVAFYKDSVSDFTMNVHFLSVRLFKLYNKEEKFRNMHSL